MFLKLHNIFTQVDTLLRELLHANGLDIRHILLAIAPDSAAVVRGYVGPKGLGDMASLLADITDDMHSPRPESDPLN